MAEDANKFAKEPAFQSFATLIAQGAEHRRQLAQELAILKPENGLQEIINLSHAWTDFRKVYAADPFHPLSSGIISKSLPPAMPYYSRSAIIGAADKLKRNSIVGPFFESVLSHQVVFFAAIEKLAGPPQTEKQASQRLNAQNRLIEAIAKALVADAPLRAARQIHPRGGYRR